jgi:L-lactate permease
MASEKNLGRNKFKNLNAAIALIAAWTFVIVSLFLQNRYGNELFSRSGSMMVLITVLAKQLLLKGKNQFRIAQLKSIDMNEKAELDRVHPTKTHHYLEIFANINILLGTLIWGYGDLLDLF